MYLFGREFNVDYCASTHWPGLYVSFTFSLPADDIIEVKAHDQRVEE